MNRRDWLKNTLLSPAAFESTSLATAAQDHVAASNSHVRVRVIGSNAVAWSLTELSSSRTHQFAPPAFEINGGKSVAFLASIRAEGGPRKFPNGVSEFRFSGQFASDPALSLQSVFRIAPESPVVRFRYILHSTGSHALGARGAPEQLFYLSVPFEGLTDVREVRLSVFNGMLHSYTSSEFPVSQRDFEDNLTLMGPILAGADSAGNSLLIAYEHGSQAPDAFLRFQLSATRSVGLNAVKGNYIAGEEFKTFETVWMEAAAATGGISAIAEHYRNFVLHSMNIHPESRKPYIFYNTWNFQERNKWWNGKDYLASMNPERILTDIDVAHRMGIEVYVMDTGWYEKTGDWRVSPQRFPDGLKPIRARLDKYGMKLGLWFNPTAAAVSSEMLSKYRQCVRSWKGKEGQPHPIWETEASYPMCLVSPYSDGFADVLIRVARDTGACYFKWDAIGQYGCDSPHHWHGGTGNTPEERSNSYAFQLPLQMARIVEKISAAFPDAIVDFDITEAGRAVGLSFLSAGKFFLINNGPYAFNYDIPIDKARQNWNLFFYPGPARTWICRSPLTYDAWIPSILFLTHYFPDDPESSQIINVASLILGQNGIWGDLPKVSDAGVDLIAGILEKYKVVRDEITESYPVQLGVVGAAPEIHEKISARTGKGATVVFSTARGRFSYVTQQKPSRSFWTTPGAHVRYDRDGHAVVVANFDRPGAAIIFFGVF